MINSIVRGNGSIDLPIISGEFAMVPFDTKTLSGLSDEFKCIAREMLNNITVSGTAYFTAHGRKLKKGQTLRRGGPHTDGNYEPHHMDFGGGNGWKVGENGPAITTDVHKRQYVKPTGGIVMASNYEACLGWQGAYNELPRVGGDCSHIDLGNSFELKRNTIYYGNNHFIHESLPMTDDIHRVFVRITMPEDHQYGYN